ncbi:MAG: hypothetical protein ABIU05_05135 [Nitrospirales bacterium]
MSTMKQVDKRLLATIGREVSRMMLPSGPSSTTCAVCHHQQSRLRSIAGQFLCDPCALSRGNHPVAEASNEGSKTSLA